MKRTRGQLRGRQAKPIVARVARAYTWYGMSPARKKEIRWVDDPKFSDYAGPKGKAGRRRRARRRARKRIEPVTPTS